MKLIVRTLKNIEVQVDVDSEETVLDLKKKVQIAFSHMLADEQMLIHCGAILENHKKISDYPNLTENDKLVVMVPKKKSATRPEEGGASTDTVHSRVGHSSTPAAQSTENKAVVSSDSKDRDGSDANVESRQVAQDVLGGESSCAVNPSGGLKIQDHHSITVDPTMVENICSMGFEKSKVEVALRAAFNNADRAVEYLMTNIPSLEAVFPDNSEVDHSTNETLQAEGGGLAALRQHPLFDQLGAAVQANPRIISGMLHMIQLQNPELFELIANNQMEFLQLFTEESGAPFSLDLPSDQNGNEQEIIHLTTEQEEAVRRISECLGFSSNAVLQALLACDWNEEYAANLLFESSKDLEEEDEAYVSRSPSQ